MAARFARGCQTLTVAALISFGAPLTASAQWLGYPAKNVPRKADGTVDVNAPPRRLADGTIDLSGFWLPTDPVRYLLNLAADYKPEDIPLQPWARALYNERIDNNGIGHPGVRCLPSGIPEKENIPDGLKIVQTPDLTLFLYDSRTIFRQVFTDGRTFPKDPQPAWMGYSIGKWDGDTFVIETIGQNGKTWLDMRGLPGTEALRVVERLTRRSIGRMDVETTIDDPKAYTRPWSVKSSWSLLPDGELIESICEENNKDLAHMVGK